MTSVLVIDDDSALLRALAITLRARGFTVTTAADGTTALSIAAGAAFDLIVLDLGLPDIDGLDLVEALRGWVVAPIIVLSARDSQAVKVDALDAGADDYVTKPFGMDELLARMRAALRRATPDPPAPVITTADFSVDLALKRIVREGVVIRLTPTEWSLLEVLVRNAGRLVSQQQLLREVWGPGYESETHYLRVYVAQLRAKLEPDPPNPRYLVTEPGMGYRFIP